MWKKTVYWFCFAANWVASGKAERLLYSVALISFGSLLTFFGLMNKPGFAEKYSSLLGGVLTFVGIMVATIMTMIQLKHTETMEEERVKRRALGAVSSYIHELDKITVFIRLIARETVTPTFRNGLTLYGSGTGCEIKFLDAAVPQSVKVIDHARMEGTIKLCMEHEKVLGKIADVAVVGLVEASGTLHIAMSNIFQELTDMKEELENIERREVNDQLRFFFEPFLGFVVSMDILIEVADSMWKKENIFLDTFRADIKELVQCIESVETVVAN